MDTTHVHNALNGAKPFQNPHPFVPKSTDTRKELAGYIKAQQPITFGSAGQETTLTLPKGSVVIFNFEPGLPVKFQLTTDSGYQVWVQGILADTPDTIILQNLAPVKHGIPSSVDVSLYLND